MPHITRWTAWPLLLALYVPAVAADNTLTPAEKQAGFRLLFDGRTFNNWLDPARQSPPGDAWIIEDGTIRTTPKPHIREDLLTKDSYTDFELLFDWKISPKGNTGVKYRIQRSVTLDESKTERGPGAFERSVERELTHPSLTRAKLGPNANAQVYTISYEFQLIDDTGFESKSAAERVHSTGALYSMIAPRTSASRPPGEWNQSRLIVKGDHFEHWVNGTKVLDGNLHSPEALAGNAKRWANAATVRGILDNAKPSGPISLQHHGAAVWFKNIKIR